MEETSIKQIIEEVNKPLDKKMIAILIDRILQKISEKYPGTMPEVLFDDGSVRYEEKRQVTNTLFQFKPLAIFLCKNNLHVQVALKLAEHFDLELRVRSGGHDHEGECSGTDALVIDFTEMKEIKIDPDNLIAHIQPGVLFKDLVPELNNNEVGLPHGTCDTVGVAGFTFGGGWGPWTRAKGMGCESLIGATIVLGDGTVKQLDVNDDDEENKALLWALRGGGGMSYGIVTELVFRVFKLPEHTTAFSIDWPAKGKEAVPALTILKRWEELIAPKATPNLVGTNIKIMATPPRPTNQPIEEAVHACTFYGYYIGTKEQTQIDVEALLKGLEPYDAVYSEHNPDKKTSIFSNWDLINTTKSNKQILRGSSGNLKYFVPDEETDAPHRITSRLVQEEGLGDAGRKTLIESLESNLITQEGLGAGIYCYVTLGAISGPYYRDYAASVKDPVGSAFPYKRRPYTIQYQAWWNADKKAKPEIARLYTNAAQNWIEESRQREFPQTKGSFISFKDSAVPTDQYFLESFNRLKEIKQKYSRDQKNKLSTRKTII